MKTTRTNLVPGWFTLVGVHAISAQAGIRNNTKFFTRGGGGGASNVCMESAVVVVNRQMLVIVWAGGV